MKKFEFKNNLSRITFIKQFGIEDSEIIRKGFLAPSMDDKWDIIFENNELSFYRSWNGIGLFKLTLENVDHQLHVVESFVDEEFLTKTSTSYCEELLNWIIEYVLFKNNIKSPKFEF